MLKLEEVNVFYGHVHALKDVSIQVEQGELVTMLGANGAGKTTFLMTLSGILRPGSGTITYEGQDLTRLNPRQIVNLGIIQCPEGRHIFGSLTVRENLQLGAVRRSDHQEMVRDLEWVCGLFPILEKRFRQTGATLSGGEQQMLAIGRALMAQPRLLLLDEPSLGLAPVIVQVIFDVIHQLHERGVTILLVEQNARKALQVADRGYILETGKVAMSGTAKEMQTNPQVEYFYLGGSAA